MVFETLVSCRVVSEHLGDPRWVIVDSRFTLANPEQGRRDYAEAHLPGAVHGDLNIELSAPVVPGKTGRHPLPDPDVLAATFSRWGIDGAKQVVAYDDGPGAIAARLWWLLRWLGHDAVAVMDGGWRGWNEAAYPVTDEVTGPKAAVFEPRRRSELLVSADEVVRIVNRADRILIDSRSEDRYRGVNEPIDPVAGHIPGAQNLPYTANLEAGGRFRDMHDLHSRFDPVSPKAGEALPVFYCGSGVTACHNILAYRHAGLGDAALYAGSWSEWITDAERPRAVPDRSAEEENS